VPLLLKFSTGDCATVTDGQTYYVRIRTTVRTYVYYTYCAHERVKNADGERRTTGERLSHVEFSVWIIIIILVQKLHVRIITCSHTDTHRQTETSISCRDSGDNVRYVSFRGLSGNRQSRSETENSSLSTTINII